MPRRNDARVAQADAGAADCAGAERPQRVRDLIAAPHGIVPGRPPHLHALHHGVRVADGVAGREAPDQHQQTRRDHRRAPAGDAVEREEDAGEHHGRAEVLLEEEEQQHQRHADDDRQQVVEPRDVEPQPVAADARLLQRAQELPPVREVAREKQHDEDADRLDGLHAHQVDLGVAGAGPAAEGDQEQREQHGAEQRHVAEAPDDRSLEVDRRHGRQHDAADRHALGEPARTAWRRGAGRGGRPS